MAMRGPVGLKADPPRPSVLARDTNSVGREANMLRLFGLAAATALAAAPVAAAPGDKAKAKMKDRTGKAVGTIALTETPHGMLLGGELAPLPMGAHGFHIHGVGKCEAPQFTSAGDHFNPARKKHGFEAAEGPHAGDLPNLHAAADGKATVDAFMPGLTLANLTGAEGTALVVHEKLDDYKTDPAGDAGGRIVCGVVQKGG
jgi:superoxide dismutase, Cu-Zn family